MPSTMSTSVSSDLFSSTVMTPTLPTFCIACAIILPIAVSPLDEMVPTWAISDDEATGLARFSRSLTTASTAISMPRLRSIGFMPAATDLAPSRIIAAAKTVAVVVPSPAASADFAHHLRAHVFKLVVKLDFLGDGDAVLGDAGSAERLIEHDVAALGTERHLHSVIEDVDTAQHAIAGLDAEFNFFATHDRCFP